MELLLTHCTGELLFHTFLPHADCFLMSSLCLGPPIGRLICSHILKDTSKCSGRLICSHLSRHFQVQFCHLKHPQAAVSNSRPSSPFIFAPENKKFVTSIFTIIIFQTIPGNWSFSQRFLKKYFTCILQLAYNVHPKKITHGRSKYYSHI